MAINFPASPTTNQTYTFNGRTWTWNGGIAGEAVTNPTFDQYRAAVGRVWKILEDGRAFASVKVS